MIKDSGERREFESGAIRDCSEGKGRCDLLPFDVVASITNDMLFKKIEEFVEFGEDKALIDAIKQIITTNYEDDMPTALLDLAIHFEEGAKKYDDDNWRKGIPLHCYIDSGVRHYLKWRRGDTDEPHDRAALWNFCCALWTKKHLPKMNDLRFAKRENNLENSV